MPVLFHTFTISNIKTLKKLKKDTTISFFLSFVSFFFKEAASLLFFGGNMESFGLFLVRVIIRRAIFAALIFVFALVGAAVGIIIGAMEGQTTETGFLRGSGIGAVTGAITAVQLLESLVEGEPLSRVALLYSLVNGKVFMEWVSPAVLKAYQWQVSSLETFYGEISVINETIYGEISGIYDTSGVIGLSHDHIQNLPQFTFQPSNILHECSCSICLHELKGGEGMRKLPHCGHLFHLGCVDKWLAKNGTCPMCRNNVCTQV